MTRISFRRYIFFFIILFLSYPIIAQNDSSAYKYWINGGIKLKSLRNYGVHLSYNCSLSKLYTQALFSAQTFPEGEGTIKSFIASVGAGWRIYERYYLVAGFLGPSLVWGTKTTADNNEEHFARAGLNIDGQLFFKPLPEIGLGIEIIQNFNSVKSFTTFQFTISLNNNK